MGDDAKKRGVNEVDKFGRSAVFYAAYYGNVEALELLTVSDALLSLVDTRHRTPLHYAAMTDNSKVIEAIFIGFKS
jgi:ankyrin repeat protein